MAGRWTFSPQTGWESAAARSRRSARSSTRCAGSRRAPTTRESARAATGPWSSTAAARTRLRRARGAGRRGRLVRRGLRGAGRDDVRDGGPARVVIDPIDGSLNARRMLPSHSLSIAVASGDSMADVEFGYVFDFGADEEFAASRGEGATLDGEPIERRRRPRASSSCSASRRRSPERALARSRRSRTGSTACASSARSRSPPPTSPPGASTRCSACAPAARSTRRRPS